MHLSELWQDLLETVPPQGKWFLSNAVYYIWYTEILLEASCTVNSLNIKNIFNFWVKYITYYSHIQDTTGKFKSNIESNNWKFADVYLCTYHILYDTQDRQLVLSWRGRHLSIVCFQRIIITIQKWQLTSAIQRQISMSDISMPILEDMTWGMLKWLTSVGKVSTKP